MRKLVVLVIVVLIASAAFAQNTTHKATLNWGASSTSGATYNVYKSSAPGGTQSLLKSGVSGLTFTELNLPANTQVCYQVSAIAPGYSESTKTSEVCGTTLADPTTAPGNLSVTVQ